MAFTRLLTLAALTACLALPATAAATSAVPVDPTAAETGDGGTVVPVEEPSAVAEPAQGDAPEAAQEDTPTTPEGEEQPPDEQPDGEQPPTEEDGGTDTPPTGGEVGGTGGETGATLPRTGFELAALTAIGLGLLLAGAALWPTSSWPPPRDRLSRSSSTR